jgi:hypothetical protein
MWGKQDVPLSRPLLLLMATTCSSEHTLLPSLPLPNPTAPSRLLTLGVTIAITFLAQWHPLIEPNRNTIRPGYE